MGLVHEGACVGRHRNYRLDGSEIDHWRWLDPRGAEHGQRDEHEHAVSSAGSARPRVTMRCASRDLDIGVHDVDWPVVATTRFGDRVRGDQRGRR